MKLQFFFVFAYCACAVSASEDYEYTLEEAAVEPGQNSFARVEDLRKPFTCYLRVHVNSASCSYSPVTLEVFTSLHTSRSIQPQGQHAVCLAVPCDSSGRLLTEATLTAEVEQGNVVVNPDSFEAGYTKLYAEETACNEGETEAIAICKDAAELAEDDGVEDLTLERLSDTSGGVARVQFWQTSWDRPFTHVCPGQRSTYYRIRSIHSNSKEDRIWRWDCRSVTKTSWNHCSWTGYVNGWDSSLNFNCPRNQVITGVRSYHNNRKEDRRWSYRCCRAPLHYTRNCQTTGWINNWDARMDFRLRSGRQVITGFYSVHSNRKEDRRWKVRVCNLVCSCSG